VPIAQGAVQCSPLIIGSHRLMDIAPESIESATLYAPANTIERRMVLARALTALRVGGRLTAAARKDKGGSRLASELTAFGCMVVDAPRQHHRIVSTTRPQELMGIDAAIAAGAYQQHPAHGLWTHAGVFSWDRIDEGSALLLNHLPTLSGRGADLGAGIGVLSRAVLHSPAITALTLIERDRRALESAKRNIDDPRAKFVWADVRDSELPTGLDFVVMNPPFHDTGVEDKTLGQAFLKAASGMLKQGGQCWLVANRHLPYEALLTECFSSHRVVTDEAGFKIITGVK
jgi:16S rRNA (guanine1207-N2)-methyltransferase